MEDINAKFTPRDAFLNQSYKTLNTKVPNLGFTKGAFWVKFKIENQIPDTNFILQINQALLDEVILYEFSVIGKQLKKTVLGEKHSFSERKYKDQYLLFDITIPSGSEHTYLLKIRSGEQILLPVQISSLTYALEINRNRDLLFGIYFGIILVMMAYNFFIFFTVKDTSYLFYVFYIFFVGFTQACLEGYSLKFLWPENFWIASRSVYFSTSLVCVSSILFLQFFLHTREYAPRFDKFTKYIYLTFIIIIVANSIAVNKYTHNLTQFAVGAVSFSILITSILVFRRGYRPAKFFLVAWIILIIGIFVFVLKDAGLIEANILTTYTLQIGSVIEVILLSLALADRINIFKKEKEESQLALVKLITEQNIVLEEKVNQRTQELGDKNIELGVTLEHLKDTQSQLVVAEKMASLGQLTAGIAHEINNPINFVSSNIKPLQMDISDILEVLNKYEGIEFEDLKQKEKLQEIVEFKKEIEYDYLKIEINALLAGIEDGAKRTAEIVKGLKNFSHLDRSEFKLADINLGIESTLILLRSSISKDTEVVLNLGNLPMVECFPGKLNQAFMNILNNAIQAIGKEKSTKKHVLTISTYSSDNIVYVEFQDSGIGMNDEVKHKIFEPFFTTKDVGEGTGLGMSIVFGIIESHSGKITVDSKPGVGSKITLALPLKLDLEKDLL